MYCTNCGKFIDTDSLLCEQCLAAKNGNDIAADSCQEDNIVQDENNNGDYNASHDEGEHITCSNTGFENTEQGSGQFSPPLFYSVVEDAKPTKKGIGLAIVGLLLSIFTSITIIIAMIASIFEELVVFAGALVLIAFAEVVAGIVIAIISIRRYIVMRSAMQKPSAVTLILGIITLFFSFEPLFLIISVFLII